MVGKYIYVDNATLIDNLKRERPPFRCSLLVHPYEMVGRWTLILANLIEDLILSKQKV